MGSIRGYNLGGTSIISGGGTCAYPENKEVSKYEHGITLVNAFKYDNDTVTPNRICIINEDSLPSCVDVYTNNFGSKDCAKRYVPERESGHWCFNDEGEYFCSKCWGYPKTEHPMTKYCPNCGSSMDNFATN